MNKSDLLNKLSNMDNFLKPTDIKICVDSIISLISSSLKKEDRIEIRGFGSFSSKRRSKHYANNPSNLEKVLVEEKLFPVFKASINMRSKVNN